MEIWITTPQNVKIEYTSGKDAYPIRKVVTLNMPSEYNPKAKNHFAPPFPKRIAILQGFEIQYGRLEDEGGQEVFHPSQHWLRQMEIVVQNHGWNVVENSGGIVSQGPDVEVIAGLRDNSGGDPPDDGFVGSVHVSALIIYP